MAVDLSLDAIPLTDCGLCIYYDISNTSATILVQYLCHHAKRLGADVEIINTKIKYIEAVFTFGKENKVNCEIEGFLYHDGYMSFDESLFQALVGVMSIHGRNEGDLRLLGINYITEATAVMAMTGLLAYAYKANRTINNQFFKISMYRCALQAMAQYLSTSKYKIESQINELYFKEYCPLPFCSQDHIYFEVETLNTAIWIDFWRSLGLVEDVIEEGWKSFQQRYANAICRLPLAFFKLVSSYDYEVLLHKAFIAGISIFPINCLSTKQHDFSFPQFEGLYAINHQYLVDKNPLNHYMNQNNELPLSNINILESCRRIQGPYAGYLLAMLGADVCRIEPPGGDPLRFVSPAIDGLSVRFDAINHNKSFIEIDIKSIEGKNKIKQLVAHSDVFLQNWAPNKADELLLNYQNLIEYNHHLIYAYCGGWNEKNPTNLIGTDFVVQAVTGLGNGIGIMNQNKTGTLMTVTDIFAGMMAAFNVVLALFCRSQREGSWYVYSSLEAAADILKISSQSIDTLLQICQLSDGMVIFKYQNIKQKNDTNHFLKMTLQKNKQDIYDSHYYKKDIPKSLDYINIPRYMSDVLLSPNIQEHICSKTYIQVKNLWG